MNENLKIGIIAFVIMFLLGLPLISANLGTFKQGDCLPIVTNLNASAVNISILTSPTPNSTIMLTNEIMTKSGSSFNYTYCNTTKLGSYTYGYCDSVGNCYSNDFKVTITGNEDINSGQGIGLMGAIIVILVISGFLFLLSFAFEGMAGKIIFVGLSAIGLIIAILFTLLSVTQILGGYTDIVDGLSTFWFVVKILVGIAFVALIVFTLFYAYLSWQKHRGFRD